MNYKVYQGTELKQTVTSKTAVMNGLQPNKTYDFSVEPDNVTNLLLGTAQPFSMTGTNTSNQCDYVNSLINGYNASSLAYKFGTQFTVSFDWSVSGSSPSGSFSAQWNDFPWNGGGIWNVTSVSSSNTSGHISNTINVSTDSNNVATKIGLRLDNFVGTITISNLRLEKGSVATTSVTTRGIRFNIPKTLTVGSTITLRYEEYPLGIVPIGNEPSGYFGGGNKQNLSAKVISTANGSSVVEVAGNVIEVGGTNLLTNTGDLSANWMNIPSVSTTMEYNGHPSMAFASSTQRQLVSQQLGLGKLQNSTQYTISFWAKADNAGDKAHTELWGSNGATDLALTADWVRYTAVVTSYSDANTNILHSLCYFGVPAGNTGNVYIAEPKLEFGDQATPYAAFVDGDTFTAQPDGTCALFSEYKALYY